MSALRGRLSTLSTRPAVFVAVLTIVLLGGTLALAQTGEAETYTGCLTRGGTLVNIAEGDTPLRPCPDSQQQIHLGSGDALLALQGELSALEQRVADLEDLLAGMDRIGEEWVLPAGIHVPGGSIFVDGSVFADFDKDGVGGVTGYFIGAENNMWTDHLGVNGKMEVAEDIWVDGSVFADFDKDGVGGVTGYFIGAENNMWTDHLGVNGKMEVAEDIWVDGSVIADFDGDGIGDLIDNSP